MHSVDHEVMEALLTWLRAGKAVHLATVLQSYGSSPRPPGSLLVVGPDGATVGSLSGGCVEDALIEDLTLGRRVLTQPERLDFGLTEEDTAQLGLPCGGHLQILLEPLAPTPQVIEGFETLLAALQARQIVLREITLDAPGAFTVTAPASTGPILELPGDDGASPLRHRYGPGWQLFVIGAGMVSRYLAEMAQALDFRVTVCDPRQPMLDNWHVAGVRALCQMPDDAIRAEASDARTAIVALTHDPRIDDMGLMEALETNAFYVGAMGSSRTSASRRARLAELAVPEAALAKLHAPVGLPIGSKTPPEIAIAILAELIQARRQAASQTP
ncbi:MAG: XdhC family protein [Pseudomonadales bacterium]|nr:XdhC family protein [Pseudomonadales bacterium]